MKKTFYDILGVSKDATDEQVKASYRKRAMVLHPDVNKSAQAEDEFRDLQEAYATISDSAKRREYDAIQRRMAAKQTAPDEVDVALSTFDIEIEPTVKKKKKKKKKTESKPPLSRPSRQVGAAHFEEIPDGFSAPSNIF